MHAYAWDEHRENVTDMYAGTLDSADTLEGWLRLHLDETDVSDMMAVVRTGVSEHLPPAVEQAWWSVRSRVKDAVANRRGLTLSPFEVYAVRVFRERYPGSKGSLFDG